MNGFNGPVGSVAIREKEGGGTLEEGMPRLVAKLNARFTESAKLKAAIRANLNRPNTQT